ncbi:MAG: hypothetical protein HGGPFJEG_01457 [Ignavibacteria bacterium]|nr:hypothetical protein [Ignavibacteria bacterium]
MENKITSQSQCDQILEILKSGDSIDALKALELVGSWGGFRARISELRTQRNIAVKDRWIKTEDGKRYKEYFL